MKKFIASIALACAVMAPTLASAGEMQFQLHGVSKHFQEKRDGTKWNEQNVGAGLRYQVSEDLGYQIGFYDNSYNKQTVYAVVNYTPFKVLGTTLGGFAGYASAYPYDLPLVAGFMSNTDVGSFVVSLRLIPKISKDTVTVIAVEIGKKF